MTSNDEKSYIFIIYNVFPVQLKRFESKILSDFEKRDILAFWRFWRKMAKNRHPTCFTENQPENGNFQNRRSQSCGEIFDSNLFCWTNQH